MFMQISALDTYAGSYITLKNRLLFLSHTHSLATIILLNSRFSISFLTATVGSMPNFAASPINPAFPWAHCVLHNSESPLETLSHYYTHSSPRSRRFSCITYVCVCVYFFEIIFQVFTYNSTCNSYRRGTLHLVIDPLGGCPLDTSFSRRIISMRIIIRALMLFNYQIWQAQVVIILSALCVSKAPCALAYATVHVL